MNCRKTSKKSFVGFNCSPFVLLIAIFLLGIILFSAQGSALAQSELNEPRDPSQTSEIKGDAIQLPKIDLRLYITSQIDTSVDSTNLPQGTQPFARKFYDSNFDDARTRALKKMVSRSMTKVLNARLEDFGLEVKVTSNPDSAKKFETYLNYYKVMNRFWPSSDGSFYIQASVSQLWSVEPVFSSSYQILYHDDALAEPDDWNLLKLNQHLELDADIKRILQELASTLVSRIDNEVIRWLVESSIKLRVAVLPFEQMGGDSTWRHLQEGLKSMVQTELSRSEAILIYADSSLRLQYSDEEPPKPNYIVHGSFFPIHDKLRIDLRCTKIPANRILTSNKVAIETLSVDRLSSKIAEASHRLKSAMLSDFRKTTKTLAIVAEPPTKYFSATHLSNDAREIAKLIVHNMTNKMQLLMAHSAKLDKGTNVKICYCNPETIDNYIKNFPNPADIINDLDIDYLVLVKTEDLGHTIRLSTNFHSYDLERPALAEYIHQDEEIKSRVESIIDATVLQTSQKLCEKRILKANQFCSLVREEESDSLQKVKSDSLQKILAKVRMLDFRRNKGAGIRAGPTRHLDRELYLGRESTPYFEIFFSVRLPDLLRWMNLTLPSWLSHELEASIGYDKGTTKFFFRRKGVMSANGFLNYKLVFSWFQYGSFPILFSCGAGPGIKGMSFEYGAGDEPYTGSKLYHRSHVKGVANFFGGIELPLSDRLGLQAVVRRILGSPEIEDFADFPFDESVSKPPVGSLDSWLVVCGIKYIWR